MKTRRLIASFAALFAAACIVSTAYPGNAEYRPPPPPPHEGGGDSGPSHGNHGGASIDLNDLQFLNNIFAHHVDESKSLMKDGPQVLRYSSTTFAVRGFVGGGWPLYVDYELDQPAAVTVTVDAGKKSVPYSAALPGGEGPQEMRLDLPVTVSKKVQPGTITVAITPSTAPNAPPAQLHILGLSCGPGAVGSDGVQDAEFNQPSISLGSRTPATYQFGCLFPFQTVVTEIVRINGNSQSTSATVVERKKLFDRRPAPVLPTTVGPNNQTQWNGRDGKSRKSLGRHELEIFAWANAANPKSWSYGASQGYLQVMP